MLRELRIHDVAIIEDVEVEFGTGLNVLSGETGAGKSIVLGALGLVLGSRSSADMVRAGSESAEVQARVDRDQAVNRILEELDISPASEDDGLLLRRIVARNGRSRAYIGQRAVPVSALRKIATVLVDYASQHEHQVLLDESRHLGILDRFGALHEDLAQVQEDVATLRTLLSERSRLARIEHEQRTREDYLQFQLAELTELHPVAGEQEELHARRLRLRNAEELAGKAQEADLLLASGPSPVLSSLDRAARRLRELVAIDPTLESTLQGIESALIGVEEAGRDLSEYMLQTRSNPVELEEIEDRLAALGHLARKHRCDVDELEALVEKVRSELDELRGLEARLEDLEPAIVESRATALRSSERLSRKRSEASLRLASVVESELESLSMRGARFEAELKTVPGGEESIGLGEGGGAPYASASGIDGLRFLLGANEGEEMKALSKTASGGELSRILLALRRALAGSSPVQTCVFDEIDSGMGGETAEVVAQKLRSISEEHQVICITHLPQIAARADRHFRVEKTLLGGRTRTTVVALDRGESVGELVRMMAGSNSPQSARNFASELLERAQSERSDRIGSPALNLGQE